jgi:hypothetical protein
MKRELVMRLSTYALCVLLVCALWRHPVVLGGCLLGISVFLLHRWHSRRDLFFCGTALSLGPLGRCSPSMSGFGTMPNRPCSSRSGSLCSVGDRGTVPEEVVRDPVRGQIGFWDSGSFRPLRRIGTA